MKSKVLVVLLITSILLTQCYTQNEYLTKDYIFNTDDDLKKVVLNDGTEREFSFNEYLYKVESDSQLITYSSSKEMIDNQIQFVSVTDTLNREEIQSLVLSELSVGNTVLLLSTVGAILALSIAVGISGGPRTGGNL